MRRSKAVPMPSIRFRSTLTLLWILFVSACSGGSENGANGRTTPSSGARGTNWPRGRVGICVVDNAHVDSQFLE